MSNRVSKFLYVFVAGIYAGVPLGIALGVAAARMTASWYGMPVVPGAHSASAVSVAPAAESISHDTSDSNPMYASTNDDPSARINPCPPTSRII
jgi:hypothetical protein